MSTDVAPAKGRLPPQIPFIIGNEAAERFSFYGMRNVLTNFLVGYLLIGLAEPERQAAAKEVFHVFVMGVYFFPLLGGWLSDRFLGKYRTIFWLSLVYCAGQVLLALSVESKPGFYAGLFLIALGSGGIKPCVSAFVGDQFDQSNKHLAKLVFDAFYWIINFGSFFASLLIPPLLSATPTTVSVAGSTLFTLDTPLPRLAFGIPALLMVLATVIFWAGRAKYVNVPPTPADPHSFLNVCWTALTRQTSGSRPGLVLAIVGVVGALGALVTTPWLGFVAAFCLAIVLLLVFGGAGVWLQLDRAKGVHPDDDVDGARAVLRVLVIFALVTPFWSLFDQKASTWILQGNQMALPGWGWFKSAAQMQALNPLLVMLLIPFNNLVLYPGLRRLGVEVTALRRMGFGIAFSGLSWIAVGVLQLTMDAGSEKLPVLWQALPYALLTFGEVLVSATGLEFAYSQAPAKLKGVLMSFWSLSVTIGNLWVLLVNASVKSESVTKAITDAGYGVMAFQMFFFAGFAFVAAAAFAAYAKRYTVLDFYRKS